MSLFEAAMRYEKEGVASILLAGKEYGSGSSRDWAGKGPRLLGVRAVIAESFERIHRSNLIGMGVLPLQFLPGESWRALGLSGEETYDVVGFAEHPAPGARLFIQVRSEEGGLREIQVISRLDTSTEIKYFLHGGILPFILRTLLPG